MKGYAFPTSYYHTQERYWDMRVYPLLLCTLLAPWAIAQSEEPPLVEKPEPKKRRLVHPDDMTPEDRVRWCQSFCRNFDRRLSVDFVDTPFQEALTFVQVLAKSGVTVDIEAGAQRVHGLTITYKCKDMPLGLILDDVVAKVGLDWTVYQYIHVATPERVRELNQKYPEMGRWIADFRKQLRTQAKAPKEKQITAAMEREAIRSMICRRVSLTGDFENSGKLLSFLITLSKANTIHLPPPAGSTGRKAVQQTIHMSLREVPVFTALDTVTGRAGLDWTVAESGTSISVFIGTRGQIDKIRREERCFQGLIDTQRILYDAEMRSKAPKPDVVSIRAVWQRVEKLVSSGDQAFAEGEYDAAKKEYQAAVQIVKWMPGSLTRLNAFIEDLQEKIDRCEKLPTSPGSR